MSNEYKLSFTAEEIDGKLKKIDKLSTLKTDKSFGNVDILPMQDVTFEKDEEYDTGMLSAVVNVDKVSDFCEGKTYIVIWNGTKYSCVAKNIHVFHNNLAGTFIGDQTIFGTVWNKMGESTIDWGESPSLPFYIHTNSKTNITVLTNDASNFIHNVHVYEEVPLENKYLDILDRNNELEIFTEQNLSFSMNTLFGVYTWTSSKPTFTLEDGKDYIITWDNEIYTRSAFSYVHTDGSSCIAVGNTLVAGGEDNGDKFAIICDLTNNFVHFCSTTTEVSHTIRICQIIPETYYVKNDYLNILDRTINEKVILPEQSIQFINGEGAPESDVFILTTGETYHILWDTDEYVLEAKSIVFNGIDGICVGNTSIVGIGEDTGEEFILGYAPSYSINLFVIQNTEESTHTVKIWQTTGETYTLKEEYLPMNTIKTYIDEYIGKVLGGDY